MAADLNLLIPEFKAKVELLLANCEQRGAIMRPYFTLRSPYEQGKLWRKSRSSEEINAEIARLKSANADFLAHCIESVGPQHGDHVTDAIPGYSWHQWGEAVDCFWLVENKAEWSPEKVMQGINGYAVYAEEAQKINLTPGGYWTSFKDWSHVQLRADDSPATTKTVLQINDEMKRRFGNT